MSWLLRTRGTVLLSLIRGGLIMSCLLFTASSSDPNGEDTAMNRICCKGKEGILACYESVHG